ncbi:MAG TPA: MGMT family protein, partial [Pirellulaceae bacterium]|nr:MGMT family protein [Pirellulaceae bacterium]
MDWHHLFETELGWVRLTYRGEAIARSGFGWTERDEALSGLGATNDVEIRFDRLPRSSEGRYRFAEACREAFDTYAANGDDRLQQLPIIEPARTEFQRAVILACRAIPAGETMTYGELATVAGSPGASRAVGNQMARNP